jgi:hypothetical protein
MVHRRLFLSEGMLAFPVSPSGAPPIFIVDPHNLYMLVWVSLKNTPLAMPAELHRSPRLGCRLSCRTMKKGGTKTRKAIDGEWVSLVPVYPAHYGLTLDSANIY